MSEIEDKTGYTIKNVTAECLREALLPVSSQAGQTLSDTWELVFGGFHTFVAKKKLTREKHLAEFQQSLIQNVQSIPTDHLQEPPLSVVGPALEASKFYFEETEVRELFLRLISSSMDDRYSSKVHVSFVEIIKQMTPLDAQNLKLFRLDSEYPITSFRYYVSEDRSSFKDLFPLVFLSNPNEQDIEKQAISISSLERLGILSCTFFAQLTSASYDSFIQHKVYKEYSERLGSDFCYYPGIVSLTPLGKSFIDVCFPPISQLIVG